MKLYIIIAIFAYLAFAVNGVIDKFLLKKAIPDSSTYAFYIGVLSASALFLFPFGFAIPSFTILVVALISGMCFVYALIGFYESLKRHDTSIVLPTIGAIVPLVTLGLSYALTGERLANKEIIGMALLILGMAFISSHSQEEKKHGHWLPYAILASLLFAVSFTLAKVVYLQVSFVSGLIWTRLGLVLAAGTILLHAPSRSRIFKTTTVVPRSSGVLFFTGQILAAGGGIMQNYAVSLGSVTIVNALQGTQFAFLFLLTWFLARFRPAILREDFSAKAMVKKILALVLIGAGLLLLK